MNDITEMILITDVKHERHPSSRARCSAQSRSHDTTRWTPGSDERDLPVEVETEDVEGTIFRRPDGRFVCIGMTKRVHDVLGLPMECWAKLAEENDRLLDENSRIYREGKEAANEAMILRKRAIDCDRRLNSLTFWQRVRILFGDHPLLVSLDNE